MSNPIAIHWFRQDLRLSDNPALTLAAKHGNVLPIYILDNENAGEYAMGAASRWWLHHSLQSLNTSLHGTLSVYQGNPIEILDDIIGRHEIKTVYWNRCYEPWRVERDITIKKHLKTHSVEVVSMNGSLLWEPWTVKKNDGRPYKVFTPFYRKGCLQSAALREPLPAPENAHYQHDTENSLSIDQLGLLPNIPWDKQLEPHWIIGEEGAHARFQQFIDKGLAQYKDKRNLPSQP